MKISFIATVLNEEKSILKLLESLKNQTQQPNEIIIVDAGSKDKTVKLIQDFHKSNQLDIKLLVKKCNRSRGRNLAIGQARGEVIASSDGGCVLDKNWLKNITKPLLSHKADVVAGFYRMKKDSIFTRCSAPFVGIMSHNINEKTFLPSSRSIAFTKAAWQKIGGYPEELEFAEDLIFAQKLRDQPEIKMVVRKSALVEWTPPNNFKKFYTSIKNYTRGNLQSGYSRHLKQNGLVIIRYALGTYYILSAAISGHPIFIKTAWALILIYLVYPSLKFIYLIRNPLDIIYLSLLQLTSDFAVMAALLNM